MKTFLTKFLVLLTVLTLPQKVQLYLDKTHTEESQLNKSLLEQNFKSSFTAHPERNNPFDIIYTTGSKIFIGCIGESGGFCVFDTKEHGMRAGMLLILGYMKKGFNTPEKFIKRYSATDQETYIKFISINMGLTKDEMIPNTDEELCLLGHLITVFEGQAGKEGIPAGDLKEVLKTGGFAKQEIHAQNYYYYDYLKKGEKELKYYLMESELSDSYFPPIDNDRNEDE